MNLTELFEAQHVVRAKIVETHNLQGQDLLPNLTLALQVELGELANETRCFKHWSVKEASEKEVILEEYADCLSFALEIGIELGYQPSELDVYISTTLVRQFINTIATVSDLDTISRDIYVNYLYMFSQLLGLGKMLGFTEQEIEQAYYAKRAINLQRQESGY